METRLDLGPGVRGQIPNRTGPKQAVYFLIIIQSVQSQDKKINKYHNVRN